MPSQNKAKHKSAGHHFAKLLRHDLSQGICHHWVKFLIPVGIALLASLAFFRDVSFVQDVISTPTWLDQLCSLFNGMRPYVPTAGEPFEVPVLYLIVNVFVAFTIGNYPVNDLATYAPYVLTRSHNRSWWWVSKCLWNVASVCLFYIGLFVGTLVFAAATGRLSLTVSGDILETIWGVPDRVDTTVLWLTIVFLPLLTSIAISLVQMTVAFVLKPIYSYFLVVVLLVSSAYCLTPLLMGNYAMLLRNRLWLETGIATPLALAVDIAVSLAAVVVGFLCFRRKDILVKEE